MNINSTTNVPYTNSDNTLQTRPVSFAQFPAKQQNNDDQPNLSDRARMLQESEMRKKSLVDSMEEKRLSDQEDDTPTDESIRVTSTIGRQKSADNLTKSEAVDVYRSIQNLL